MSGTEYNIVGDTKDYKGCLIMTCGKSEERAKEVLRTVCLRIRQTSAR